MKSLHNIIEIFYSDRLIIRKPSLEDIVEVNKAVKDSLIDLKPWLGFAQNEPTLIDSESDIRSALASFIMSENLRYHIFDKETKNFVGSIGLLNIDWDIPKFEIGFWINSRFSNKGFATEAVQVITEYAFSKLAAQRVEMPIDMNNSGSRKVAEKVGFDLEGILRKYDSHPDGYLIDVCIDSKIKK